MTGALQTSWAALILDAFAGAGVTDVVISPGSRSTPFVVAAARHPALRCHAVIDERVAGFFALGMAKASGRPPLLLCTSGSAPAHYHPAVIEAAASATPLLIVSADRPLELHGCGALQTVDQLRLYGPDARAFFDLGVADASPAALRATRRAVVQAVAAAHGPLPGAVQVNARARKPLEPTADDDARVAAVRAEPLPRAFAPRLCPDAAIVDEIARACVAARRGLIVAGPAAIAQAAARPDVAALCVATGFPLIAEAGSQLRGIEHACGVDPLARLLDESADVVVQLGASPTPSSWDAYLDRHPPGARFVIAAHGWPDPLSRASAVISADVAETARAVARRVDDLRGGPPEPTAWHDRVLAAERRARAAAAAAATGASGWNEGHIAAAAVAAAPAGSLFLVANSLPIRELEIYARPDDLRVITQRGASGIDGLIAGAAGACATGVATTLLLGDIAFLHDVGALAVARAAAAPLAIVVVNNDGGRIFAQLPVAGTDVDLTLFTTPHGLSFGPAAALFGIPYRRAETRETLAAALAEAHDHPGATIVEAVVPPDGAAALARALAAALKDP